MTRAIRVGLATLGVGTVALAAVSFWALESAGVAVVETQTADGETRETHVWYARDPNRGGELWLEAGSPDNGWYVDVLERPQIVFVTDSGSEVFVAEPIDDGVHHEMIRRVIREKYGFRDWWVNLLVDTSESVAVRLVAPPPVASP